MNFVMSYSCGKDSALALYRMIRSGHTPVALLTTVNVDQNRSWFHGVQRELMEMVSESVNIPLLVCACKPDQYTESLTDGLKMAKNMGAEACVFGDIDIDEHRKWNEERCAEVGLACILPLWQESRESLTQEGISSGFKAMIKIIRSDVLDETFLGQTLDAGVIERIRATGADVCGENGEYHTFVYDGPIFAHAIPIECREIIDFTTHKAVDIVPAPNDFNR